MGERRCGDCVACCALMTVKEISKPAGQMCPKACAKGCSIYADRPGSCRAFECLWLQDEVGVWNSSHRPDRFGLMFSYQYGTAFGDVMSAFEVWPGASEEEEPAKMLRKLSEKMVIIVLKGDRRTVLAPLSERARVEAIIREKTKWSGEPPPPTPGSGPFRSRG